MKAENPFDKKLKAWKGHLPSNIHDASVYVTDTLDLAWAAAQAVFEEQQNPNTH